MTKLKLELGLALPSDAVTCDVCVGKLLQALGEVAGIEKAHVDRSKEGAPRLCLHYDPVLVRMKDLEKLVSRVGASLLSNHKHLSLPLRGLRHERQAELLESLLAREPGVLHAAVSFGARRAVVEFDPEKTDEGRVRATLQASDVEVEDSSLRAAPPSETEHEEGHSHDGLFGERTELIFSLATGVLTGAGWMLGRFSVPRPVATIVFIVAYVLGGWFTVKEVFVALRARRFEIDFLMLLAAVGAALLGEWMEGALLLFLFTLGHALEGYAMQRARNAIAALAELAPETAIRVDGEGAEAEVPVSQLAPGDRVLVKPNTRVPSDGFVIAGESAVNQAPITGESVPVEKRPVADAAAALSRPESIAAAHKMFAGSINGTSALTIVVTKASKDSTLARIIELVSEAETQKSPTQQFTDRVERILVPSILVLEVFLLFAWVVIDEPFSRSFYRAMAVLVAASPCALAIATPSAILSAVARAARGGVLVKGGAHLETLGIVRAIAFDKTGTLTEGRPRLTDVVSLQGAEPASWLARAVAVEKRSDHPLARAVVEGAKSHLPDGLLVPEALGVEAVVGVGVKGNVDGVGVFLAKPEAFANDAGVPPRLREVVAELQDGGRSVIVVRVGAEYPGVLGVMDTPRELAKAVVASLHRLGIETTVMLSGDNQKAAEAVAKAVGIRVARGNLLPEEKVEAVRELSRSGTKVAMVGDGVNDAPAMANATVGIAMGASGSDVALETADVALMADDLRALPFAVGLSRAARSVIRQNLWMSLGMVAFLIPATIFGFARIGIAVALHEGSTLLVVVNALRLLAYRAPVDSGVKSSIPSA